MGDAETFHITSLQIPISLHKSENNVFESGLLMRAIIQSSQISTPSAVLRFDSVVGRKPATVPLLVNSLHGIAFGEDSSIAN